MKHLLFNKEKFDNGGYSKIIQDVVTILIDRGVIMSPDASMEAYKAIWEKAVETTAESIDGESLNFDTKLFTEGWEQLKKEL